MAIDKEHSYRRLDWSTKRSAVLSKTAIRTFDVAGDHLTIVNVLGSLPAYVRLGDESNPWIQVHSRMVLTRAFDKVAFADGGFAGQHSDGSHPTSQWDTSGVLGEIRVSAFASFGPLVSIWPPKEYGLRRAPLMVKDLPVGTVESDPFIDLMNPGATKGPAIGLNGATALLLNTGGADLYIKANSGSNPQFPLFSGTYGFGPIVPGASLELKLDDVVFGSALQGSGLYVYTLAGSTTLAMLISSGEYNSVEPGLSLDPDPLGLA